MFAPAAGSLVAQLIASYGYWAILVGTFLEGETVLVLGGYASHRGWLALPIVVLAAFGGSFFGDQLYFAIGRHHGRGFVRRRPAWQDKIERVTRMLERHQNAVIVGSRFLYGLRIVTPLAIGLADVGAVRFLLLNVVGAAVWASGFGVSGYYVGALMQRLLGDLERYEVGVLAAIALTGAGVWGVRALRRRRKLPPWYPPPLG